LSDLKYQMKKYFA